MMFSTSVSTPKKETKRPNVVNDNNTDVDDMNNYNSNGSNDITNSNVNDNAIPRSINYSLPHATSMENNRVNAHITKATINDINNNDSNNAKEYTQLVPSVEDGNALSQRIKQLERETATLTKALTKICDENSNLAQNIASLESKVNELSSEPLKQTPILHSLFEPEKTGWFGGSKQAAQSKVQELLEELQHEYMNYKVLHASSNDEVEALVAGLNSAHTHSQELSRVIAEQQEMISHGPLTVIIKTDHTNSKVDNGVNYKHDMKREDNITGPLIASEEEAHRMTSKTINNVNDLELIQRENVRLQKELSTLREALATEERLHALKVEENTSLMEQLAQTESSQVKAEIARLRNEVEMLKSRNEELQTINKNNIINNSRSNNGKNNVKGIFSDNSNNNNTTTHAAGMAANQSHNTNYELETKLQNALQELQASKVQLNDVIAKQEQKVATLQGSLFDSQGKVAELTARLNRTVAHDDYNKLNLEKSAIAHELELCRNRIVFLENNMHTVSARHLSTDDHMNSSTASSNNNKIVNNEHQQWKNVNENNKINSNDNNEEDEEDDRTTREALALLDKNKERLARVEFERKQLEQQLADAQNALSSQSMEVQRLEQSNNEDKQRVSFLLKKCATAAAEVRSITLAHDTLNERYQELSLQLKQRTREVEQLQSLQVKYDELHKEKQQLEARLASASEIEEKLVKAKETIAYMELAQSRSINMSQYAALQAEKEKLENTMAPLQRKCDEATREVERLKSVTDAQQAIAIKQKNEVQSWQERMNALNTNEVQLRDKVNYLTSENERLREVNNALEAQMSDMQAGIKEMAVQMDKARTEAKIAAEANMQKEINELKEQLQSAQSKLSTIEANENGAFVADGVHKAIVAERDKLLDDVKRKTFDMEKMKSEILIYRQTIADLENENDEHVKEIEVLQERHQGERAVLTEKLALEQQRTTELSLKCDNISSELKEKQVKSSEYNDEVKEINEKLTKTQRGYEDKCHSEQKLAEELARVKSELAELKAHKEEMENEIKQLTRVAVEASTSSNVPIIAPLPSTPSVLSSTSSNTMITVPNVQATNSTNSLLNINSLNTKNTTTSSLSVEQPSVSTYPRPAPEVQLLQSELMRLRAERAYDTKLISILQSEVKNGMSEESKTTYNAEVERANSLQKMNAILQKDNAQLKKNLFVVAQATENGTLASSSHKTNANNNNSNSNTSNSKTKKNTSLPSEPSSIDASISSYMSRVQDPGMKVSELELELQAQRDAFEIAMNKAVDDIEVCQQRIRELEQELRQERAKSLQGIVEANFTTSNANNLIINSGDIAATTKTFTPISDKVSNEDGNRSDEPISVTPKARKVRRVKKKRTITEQVTLHEPTHTDILDAMTPDKNNHNNNAKELFASSGVKAEHSGEEENRKSVKFVDVNNKAEVNDTHSRIHRLTEALKVSENELQSLRAEYFAAQNTINELKASKDIERHEGNIDNDRSTIANANQSNKQDKKREEQPQFLLGSEIDSPKPLEKRSRLPSNNNKTTNEENSSMSKSGSTVDSYGDDDINKYGKDANHSNDTRQIDGLQKRLDSLMEELERVKAHNAQLERENEELRRQIKETNNNNNNKTANATPSKETNKANAKLARQVKEMDATISMLNKQLLPIKSKLTEYMALADRLGISYPFSEELESNSVLRLHAIRSHGKAVSLPRPDNNNHTETNEMAKNSFSTTNTARNTFASNNDKTYNSRKGHSTNDRQGVVRVQSLPNSTSVSKRSVELSTVSGDVNNTRSASQPSVQSNMTSRQKEEYRHQQQQRGEGGAHRTQRQHRSHRGEVGDDDNEISLR